MVAAPPRLVDTTGLSKVVLLMESVCWWSQVGDVKMRSTEVEGRRRQTNSRDIATQVFYADGERACTRMVEAALDQLDVEVTRFDNASDCLHSLKTRECHLLISNARRPHVEGMELLRGAADVTPPVPVVVLVDRGDIDAAVGAMKGGAVDCLERPPETVSLVSAIDSALQVAVGNDLPPKRPLSEAEEHVLRLILQGHTTNEIARRLHRSPRTIEVHRHHIMRKLNASSMVGLVKSCVRKGLLPEWPCPRRSEQ